MGSGGWVPPTLRAEPLFSRVPGGGQSRAQAPSLSLEAPAPSFDLCTPLTHPHPQTQALDPNTQGDPRSEFEPWGHPKSKPPSGQPSQDREGKGQPLPSTLPVSCRPEGEQVGLGCWGWTEGGSHRHPQSPALELTGWALLCELFRALPRPSRPPPPVWGTLPSPRRRSCLQAMHVPGGRPAWGLRVHLFLLVKRTVLCLLSGAGIAQPAAYLALRPLHLASCGSHSALQLCQLCLRGPAGLLGVARTQRVLSLAGRLACSRADLGQGSPKCDHEAKRPQGSH